MINVESRIEIVHGQLVLLFVFDDREDKKSGKRLNFELWKDMFLCV